MSDLLRIDLSIGKEFFKIKSRTNAPRKNHITWRDDTIELTIKVNTSSLHQWMHFLEEWKGYSETDLFEVVMGCFEEHQKDYPLVEGPSI